MMIGRFVYIGFSSQQNQSGLFGQVIDETKNLLIINTGNSITKVQKIASIFTYSDFNESELQFKKRIEQNNVNYINGKMVLKRPYEYL